MRGALTATFSWRGLDLRFLFLLAAAFVATIQIARAQDDRERDIAAATQTLQDIRDTIPEARRDDVETLEERLRALRDGSRERLEPIRRDISRAEADRAALGPAPGENDPPESETLAQRRAETDSRVAALRGQEIQVSANIAEATELLAHLSTLRVGALYRQATERGPGLLSMPLWGEGLSSAREMSGKIGRYFANWNEAKRDAGGLLGPILSILAALGVSLLMFGPVNRWITASFTARIERYQPTPDRRVLAAGLKMIARAAPGIAGGLILFITLGAVGVITPEGRDVARAAWFALVAFLLISGFIAGLFASKDPKWRIAPLMEAQGREAGLYLTSIVAIFGVKTVLGAVGEATDAAPAVARLLDGASAVAIGVLLFLLCQKRLWTAPAEAADAPSAETEGTEPGRFWPTVRRLSRVVALVTVAAPFLGYVDLADFITSRFYALALILAIAWFSRALLREIAGWAERRFRPSTAAKGEDEAKSFERFWINAAIDTVFAIALLPALLVLVGFNWSAVADLFQQAFFGFRIGGFQTPSLARVLFAVLAFLVVIGLTRMTQRGLARGPFAHSRLDVGVQNSLTTLLGYAGLIVAMLAAIAALGFKLGNLAIIAGALSVGIGFGLQSIVNNFVSGLILLFERPIKVGDWVVTTSGEGTVKKISVRSTEIETFDRATIVVPNSELISQTVTNWTHKDKIGRITVPVGVSYSADPELVKDILLKCARDHPLIVRYPEPFVVWQDFGASSLDFEIRAYLRDISNGLSVRTDLRFAIFKAFKEAGVEIPFPQQDVYIKSLPEALARKPARRTSGSDKADNRIPPNEPEEPELAEDD